MSGAGPEAALARRRAIRAGFTFDIPLQRFSGARKYMTATAETLKLRLWKSKNLVRAIEAAGVTASVAWGERDRMHRPDRMDRSGIEHRQMMRGVHGSMGGGMQGARMRIMCSPLWVLRRCRPRRWGYPGFPGISRSGFSMPSIRTVTAALNPRISSRSSMV